VDATPAQLQRRKFQGVDRNLPWEGRRNKGSGAEVPQCGPETEKFFIYDGDMHKCLPFGFFATGYNINCSFFVMHDFHASTVVDHRH